SSAVSRSSYRLIARPDTRFAVSWLLSLDVGRGGVDLVLANALARSTQNPVQVFLDGSRGFAGSVHEQRSSDRVAAVDGHFDAGRDACVLVIAGLDARCLDFGRVVRQTAVPDGAGRFGDQVHHVLGAVHVA